MSNQAFQSASAGQGLSCLNLAALSISPSPPDYNNCDHGYDYSYDYTYDHNYGYGCDSSNQAIATTAASSAASPAAPCSPHNPSAVFHSQQQLHQRQSPFQPRNLQHNENGSACWGTTDTRRAYTSLSSMGSAVVQDDATMRPSSCCGESWHNLESSAPMHMMDCADDANDDENDGAIFF
mmetsp:Transcript_23391/g.65273  ORF Transcript_23391/g.65273 Transcript_23391/m.65273 type:complete len:180 (-) Transcript_23391:2538-3077(-)|eukprot:CAMPEP_0198126008 /NCGR_PEP_ID=MMETSP1442-20131203/43804_1 /TAXON_ID= /ORGANISM="Craspedostauros australis, Strain CCMP3328" /LENGTH=179 /DNA_ID=CAMNT_0043785709 /DNA_START=450 /DNA_END=989 /DNA_ORIENTATION=-